MINTIDCDLIGLGIELIELKLLLKQLIDIDLDLELNQQTLSSSELYESEQLESMIHQMWNDAFNIYGNELQLVLNELRLCVDCDSPFKSIYDDVCVLYCDECCFVLDVMD